MEIFRLLVEISAIVVGILQLYFDVKQNKKK